jgi:phenylalanyl-tRNA synthetase alpha chain
MIDLRAQEQKILSTIDILDGKASVEQLIEACNLPNATIMRTALTLQEKSLLTINVQYQNVIKLTSEGEKYAKNYLPERKLIQAIAENNGEAELRIAAQQAGLSQQFVQIALGWAIRKKWVTYNSQTNRITLNSENIPQGNDEKLLNSLGSKKEATVEELTDEMQTAVDILKKRKLLTVETKATRILQITETGKQALQVNKSITVSSQTAPEVITQLTPQLIITGKWRQKKMQQYNIQAPVAKTWSGKKHPYLAFLDEVRAKLVQLGFKEMTGPQVETSFFNFDALYVPQDHPARESTDIYYIKDPEHGDISQHQIELENVKYTHENGWITGSTGWGYQYSFETAKRLILRGHGTCLSARTLKSKNLEIPSRHFSIARVYRPEITDKTHLSEFNQVEGIIIDENLTIKDLLGVLGKFATEIAGADKVRFKPDYFPFTEPSVELSAYKEGYGWVEFGGSGIFRPEVTLPLGVKVPVIAWGLGVDRLFMMRAGIDDIRMIFSQDLDWLRKKQVT